MTEPQAVKKIDEQKKEIFEFFSEPKRMKQIEDMLPKVGITGDRMIRFMFSAFRQLPNLTLCSKGSLFNAMIQLASLGLEPNTPLGHAWLIPFKDNKKGTMEVTTIIGYKGFIVLALRSGMVSSIEAHIVYECDKFSYEYGTESYLRHIPEPDVKKRGKITCGYSVAHLKDGGFAFDVMSLDEILEIKKRSKALTSGPWVTDEGQMMRKTSIRRLMNYLPLSSEVAKAVAIDASQESEGGGQIFDADFIDIAEEIKPTPTAIGKMAEEEKKKNEKKSPSAPSEFPKEKPGTTTTSEKPTQKEPGSQEERSLANESSAPPIEGLFD